jgi:hypothetical protein
MLTDIHASSEIRTHDPSVSAGEVGSWFRPRGLCDRHVANIETSYARYRRYKADSGEVEES